eukprot:TRINITY_DN723_c0_g1_i2.p1 TRINITY_DN723_c0_g1~~TRINITY_DN723_c0_g1_i2.p1  ORF type:complete len:152 (-),score=42.41 TRINITY_DN723_c0_g1_i2:94-549(-)
MVTDPENYVEPLKAIGANQMTVHIEAIQPDPSVVIKQIKAAGMRAGVALKPGTGVEAVLPFVSELDMVLVMTVEPGFGGQSFMEDQMNKVKALRSAFPSLDIQVDGGLGETTTTIAAAAGANVIVAGSAIFKSKQPENTIASMRKSVTEAL